MKKIIFLFCYFWAAMTALNAQNLRMYGKYDMEDPEQFNDVVFREAPVAFAYDAIDYPDGGKSFFVKEEGGRINTTYLLKITHILRNTESNSLRIGDTIAVTVDGGYISKEWRDTINGTSGLIEYGGNGHGRRPIYYSGIVFCKPNNEKPVFYKNYDPKKSFILFYDWMMMSDLIGFNDFGGKGFSGMGKIDLHISDFYNYIEKYERFNAPKMEESAPCTQETTPPIIEKVSQPKKKKGGNKNSLLRKIGLGSKSLPNANLYVRIGNESITGFSDRYLEFDIFLRTDQAVAIGATLLVMKFDGNIFGTYAYQDTNRLNISTPSALQNKIRTTISGFRNPSTNPPTPTDSIQINISQKTGQVLLLSKR